MTTYRIVLMIAMVIGPSLPLAAQGAPERDAVMKTMQAFFDTMTARDVDGARKILVPQGRFHAMNTSKPGGEPQSLSSEEYFAQLQQSNQTMRERIWNAEVRIHGPIATVWAPYDFWIGGKYSHCGIDAFDLVKTTEGWKISGGVFTMEATCAPSPLGPPKP